LGYIANLCAHYELKVQGVKRLRVGKMPLAGLAPGQWRFLQPHERF
jgi:23S rRNA pseudouridine2604 synthase